ncbi:MAG TPA: response regulator transcription factor [Chitinophagaceae bacterium]
MKILIAEDEAAMLEVLQASLKGEGYDLVAASDGQQALDQYRAVQPDLIITDILMPYTSGLELLSIVKSDGGLQVPVIVLSAMGQEATVIEAFNLGADDFLTKPFNPVELKLRVRKLLQRKGTE